ncbi:hypothetical protein AAVH_33715, partial [Aphelenchoides avenae]
MFFVQDYRARTAGSGCIYKETIRAAALEWNQLSGEERLPFLYVAIEDKARHAAEQADQ